MAAIYERLKSQKKTLTDEKSSVKRKLDALDQFIEQRKNRYEILSATLGGSGDDGGGDDERDYDRSSFTISEHRIRLAREKLELQDTGDRLDDRVQKLETEIRAMENTLHVLNASNDCYKSHLSYVNPQSQFSSFSFARSDSDKLFDFTIIQWRACVAGEVYKDKIRLEETYNELNSEWLRKKKILKDVHNEIRASRDEYYNFFLLTRHDNIHKKIFF